MFNLLELRNGNVAALGDANLSAGHYTQIHLHLDAAEDHGSAAANPGCFITYSDSNKTTPLYVPSGSQTGIKLIGEYDVPANGVISLVIDFDIRKSIVVPGNIDKLDDNASFKLKPTLRLIVDSEAGEINGTIDSYAGDYNLTVYAYEDGSYDDNESNTSAEIMFPNAVTSTDVHPEGAFKLPFLAAGTYDLVVTENNVSGFVGVYGYINDVIVVSGERTELGSAPIEAAY